MSDMHTVNDPCDILLPYDSLDGASNFEHSSLLQELLDDIDMPPPEQFEQDLEQSLSDNAYGSCPPTLPQFEPYAFDSVDWIRLSLTSLSFPVSSDDGSFAPCSPVSDATLVSDLSSSIRNDWSSSTDPGYGTAADFSDAPAAIDAYDGFQFRFECEVQVSRSRSTLASSLPYYGYTQQPLQHDPCVAAADAHSRGLRMTAEPDGLSPYIAFPPQSPTRRSFSPPPTVNKRERESSVKDIDEPAPVKRRRPSTQQFECSECDVVIIGRSHNLKVHIATVHGGQREFPCEVANCTMAFARKHDRTRHIQSKHTDRGSPRKKAPRA